MPDTAPDSTAATTPAAPVTPPAVPTQQTVVAPVPAPAAMRSAGFPVAPMLPQMPVVKGKSYAAPLSFVGSTRRIGALIARLANGNAGIAVALWLTLGWTAISAAWAFIACWYVVIFGLFGIFTFPYRLVRRSQRKSQHLQQVTLATQQAMLLQQQQLYYGQGR
jgi:hypothetical protein